MTLKKKFYVLLAVLFLFLIGFYIINKNNGKHQSYASENSKYLSGNLSDPSQVGGVSYFEDKKYTPLFIGRTNDGKLYFLVEGYSWTLYGDNNSILSRNKSNWENYYNNSVVFKKSLSSNFFDELYSFKQTACQAIKEDVIKRNNYDEIEKFNASPCYDADVVSGKKLLTEKIAYKQCGSSPYSFNIDDSGNTRQFNYYFEEYEYADHTKGYASLFKTSSDSTCAIWSVNDIYDKASDKKGVCNQFKKLYDLNLLDYNTIKALSSLCKLEIPEPPSNVNDAQCGKNYYTGAYFNDISKARINKCEDIGSSAPKTDLSSCTWVMEQKLMTLKNTTDKRWFGFIPSFTDNTTSFIGESCNNSWSISEGDASLLKHDGGCDYLKNLANKGFLSKEQIDESNNNGCNVATSTTNVCSKTEAGYTGKNGIWVSKSVYYSECEDFNIIFYTKGNVVESKGDSNTSCKNDQCVYKFNINKSGVGINTKVNVPLLRDKATDNKFAGWSKDSSSCLGASTNQLTIQGNGSINYYPCYAKDQAESNASKWVYENVPTKTYISSYEYKNSSPLTTCNLSSNDNNGMSSKISGQLVGNTEYNNSISGGFSLNKYCSIKCYEVLKYTYPGIFQTITSGTYFKLMYNPEITATKSCVETVDVNSWKTAYDIALQAEYDAYFTYKAAKQTYDSIPNEDNYSSGSWCMVEGIDGCMATGSYYYYSYTLYSYDISAKEFVSNAKTTTKYYEDVNHSISSTMALDSAKSDRSSLVSKWKKEADDTRASLLDTINKRKLLESQMIICDNSLRTGGIGYSTSDLDGFVENSSDNSSIDTIANEKYLEYSKTNSACDLSGTNCTTPDSNPTYNNKTTKDFYNINNSTKAQLKINVEYETGIEGKIQKEELTNAYSRVVKDTDSVRKNGDKIDNSFTIDGTSINFSYYTTTAFERTVIKNFQYEPSQEYFINENSSDGEFLKNCSGNCISLGRVFPVDLSSTGKKNIKFNLSGDYLTSTDKLFSTPNDSDLEYNCTFDVTNDVVIPDGNKDGNFWKVRTNYYVRSISTSNVDPNDRFKSGTLGRNWSTDKGQALIKIIQNKSKNSNTYNPSNLEYSITLTPESISKIVNYNKTHKYDDFEMDCNKVGGECFSRFITNYVDGNIAGVTVSIADTMTKDKLNSIRKSWKYYLEGKWEIVDNTTYHKNYTFYGDDAKKKYDADYASEGVLP